ncbi:MAG: selenide, water dikinase [Turicibacter sp.]|nr:selenide, water dikinase [Turicibacter sp.]
MRDFKLLILLVMIIVLAAVLIYSVIVVSKKKQYYVKIDELDNIKHNISNQTVPFELAKLRSTKKSERIVKLVQQWEYRWEKLESEFITVTEEIIHIEELVANKNFTEADELLEELDNILEGLTEEVTQLNEEIKSLKKSEERSRSNIVSLKDRFEELKLQYEEEEEKYVELREELKAVFKDIEVFFLKFNECMEECNYDLADETIELIKSQLDTIVQVFERSSMYKESIENEMKPLLEEVLNSYEYITKSGIYLQHLQIAETITTYQEQLDDMPNWIKRFEFSNLEAKLMEIHDNAKQMIEFMKKEYELQDIVKETLEVTQSLTKEAKEKSVQLQERYNNIKENYRMPEDEESNFNFLLSEIQIVSNEVAYLVGKVEERRSPNTLLVRELSSMNEQLKEINNQLQMFDGEIESLYAGEKECRQHALNLLKTFNHLKGTYHQVKFPIENQEIKELIKQANHSVHVLFETIGRLPINISDIDEKLSVAQEAIEHLSTLMEVEVQQLQLAERLMVYGHRYIGKEGMYIVDITIAEDQFRQGNYLTVIEKMRELLKEIEGTRFDLTYNQFKQELDCYLL